MEELDALQGDTCKRRKEQNPLPESGASALDRIGLVDPALLREMMQAAEKIHSRHPSIEKVAVKVVKKLARHVLDVRLEVNTQRRGRLKLIDDVFQRLMLQGPSTRAKDRKKVLVVHDRADERALQVADATVLAGFHLWLYRSSAVKRHQAASNSIKRLKRPQT